MFFLITDDNTNLTEINSINNNRNVTLINNYLIVHVQATSVSSEQIFSVANIQLVQPGTGYQQRIFVQASALIKIIRKINTISTVYRLDQKCHFFFLNF